MKSTRILDALSHVDDNLLELCETYTPVRRHPRRWLSAAACVTLAALSAAAALHAHRGSTPKPAASISWQDMCSESAAAQQTEAASAETSAPVHLPLSPAPEPTADTDKALPETKPGTHKAAEEAPQGETAPVRQFDDTLPAGTKYPSLIRGGQDYTSRGTSKPIVGEKIQERAVLTGFDGIHTTEAELFAIQGVRPDAAVAVRFPETGEVYAYVNTDYRPATLGQFWDDLNLDEYLSFGKVYFEATYYAGVPKGEIEKLLVRSAPYSTKNDVSPKNVVMSIRINIPVLGYTNHAFQLTSDGYLHTNLLESGKDFYIGQACVQAFVNYVHANCDFIPQTSTFQTNATAAMTSSAARPAEE